MNLEIKLQADFWNKSPDIVCKLNNKQIAEIQDFEHMQEKKINVDVDVNDGENQLVIERANKPVKDTVIVNNEIVKDSKVKIMDISIDNISIEPLLDEKGIFYPIYPEPWQSQQKALGKSLPEHLTYSRTLHHNGAWKIKFDNPIHVWFFQNINVKI